MWKQFQPDNAIRIGIPALKEVMEFNIDNPACFSEVNRSCELCGSLDIEATRRYGQGAAFKCKKCGWDKVVTHKKSLTHLTLEPPESIYSRFLKEGSPGIISLRIDGAGELKVTCKNGHTSHKQLGMKEEFGCSCGEQRVVIEVDELPK
jgi:hypothetical protein